MADSTSKEHARDGGLAIVLILLLAALFSREHVLILSATIVLVLVMTCPSVFRPWARLWFAFSHLLGGIVSKILLSGVFALIVVPIALLRKLLGADAMGLKKWRDGTGSVFNIRNHSFTGQDLEKPY